MDMYFLCWLAKSYLACKDYLQAICGKGEEKGKPDGKRGMIKSFPIHQACDNIEGHCARTCVYFLYPKFTACLRCSVFHCVVPHVLPYQVLLLPDEQHLPYRF